MLLRFEVSNHRSIHEPVELSMIAIDAERLATRGFEMLAERVLTVAGVYGPNASGKSNVLDGLAWLSAAVARSLRTWSDIIPREPFKFGSGPMTPSTYAVEMIVDGVRYVYRLEVDDSRVLFEGLYNYPQRRRRVLFERSGENLTFRRGLRAFGGTRELLTPSTLALSAAMKFDEPEIDAFGRSLAGLQFIGRGSRAAWRRNTPGVSLGLGATARLFDEPSLPAQATLFEDPSFDLPSDRDLALALLRFADLGIGDVQVVNDIQDDLRATPPATRAQRRQLYLMHQAEGQQLAFDFSEESEGTQRWFALIGPTLTALRRGRILLVDEIDASLHPRLSARLLELFADPETNRNGAQLIFASHDTSLLNHLNRDEVWLTQKSGTGATTLVALAEYGGDKVRRSVNLEKAYLQGRFGAVPELDQFVLRRALGLAPGDE